MPKRASHKSEYSHTIYSNTRSRTKKKNIDRHKRRKEEEMKLKKNNSELVVKKKKKIVDGFSV